MSTPVVPSSWTVDNRRNARGKQSTVNSKKIKETWSRVEKWWQRTYLLPAFCFLWDQAMLCVVFLDSMKPVLFLAIKRILSSKEVIALISVVVPSSYTVFRFDVTAQHGFGTQAQQWDNDFLADESVISPLKTTFFLFNKINLEFTKLKYAKLKLTSVHIKIGALYKWVNI